VRAHERAIALDPGHAKARNHRALGLLAQGAFAAGWAAHESRWGRPGSQAPRATSRPGWRGAGALEGRRLLLTGEQGMGDQIQFLRYAPLAAARGATVLLEVSRPLLALCADLAGVSRATGDDAPLGDGEFDLHCPLMSLPLAFGTTLETIPAAIPYLAAPADALARWSARLGSASRPRIGVAWSGNPAHGNDRNRSLALARLAALFDARAEWISLQREVRAADRDALAGLRHFGAEIGDFGDAAALCAGCDLVIAADTAMAHLAGALGRPVWILLPFAADWRWLTDRADSPWYPTARLYRQERPGDWDAVLARVGDDLRNWLAAPAPVKSGPPSC
jgi:hypothetical protein